MMQVVVRLVGRGLVDGAAGAAKGTIATNTPAAVLLGRRVGGRCREGRLRGVFGRACGALRAPCGIARRECRAGGRNGCHCVAGID